MNKLNKRYIIQCCYKGTNYCGWQIQPNAATVQETISKGLTHILRSEINLQGAGRTDTGVHATFYVAHFDYNSTIKDPGKLTDRLNRYLPQDIRIDLISEVDSEFHSRFDAVSRSYRYIISLKKNPFNLDTAYHLYRSFNISEMNKCCTILKKHKDFTSFCKLHADNKTNDCTIYNAEWIIDRDELIFNITADRFLRNMVRAIVGTMLDVGREKLSAEQFERIILQKNRCKAGFSVPAHGLFLSDIQYREPVNSILIR